MFIVILGLCGMGISGYLTYGYLAHTAVGCPFNANCDLVQASPYAYMWGVPVPLLGLLMYAALTLMGLLLFLKKPELENMASLGIYGISLAGVIFTVYLYYLELFVLHAFCSWCIVSSIVILSIFILSLIYLNKIEQPGDKKGRKRRFRLSDYIQW
ncbi:MAG TPA: vitamin K epoxide reductase family protein [Dehalococcoidia bacterium]|nr:vitamin K epoxide reductase family protein [Dehalococcoidia bacterium]